MAESPLNHRHIAISTPVVQDWIQTSSEIKFQEEFQEGVPAEDIIYSDFYVNRFQNSNYVLWGADNISGISCTLNLTIDKLNTNKLLLDINEGERFIILRKGAHTLTLSNVFSISIQKQKGDMYKGKCSIQLNYLLPASEIDFSHKPVCHLVRDKVKYTEVSAVNNRKSRMVQIDDKTVTLKNVHILIEGFIEVKLKKQNGTFFSTHVYFDEILSVWLCLSENSKVECELASSHCECLVFKKQQKRNYSFFAIVSLCLNVIATEDAVICINSKDLQSRDEI
ncbi:hypothetical protein Q9R38_07470 [Priestia aryabhattai]|uniref:hypothetical protein n=1 Tax=Priestia aryabhattai TaxID=412384 RepID=UPI002881126D|nr:hypothetical protein [Priestia aryabhattai]MDT0146339.1 hypothetical protein [Priestia aryabhattai]MDT0150507.1 hypothetical protein [Priestia aryabhattai]MED3998596.1 hypothetical protein [Priestia aryabhattai]